MKSKRVKILTVPHSGTRYVHSLLRGSQLAVSGPTDPFPDRDGQVLHWHALPPDDPTPKIAVLREPLATFISHEITVPSSRLPREQVWAQRLEHIRHAWSCMSNRLFTIPFVCVERLEDPKSVDYLSFEASLKMLLDRPVELDFSKAKRFESEPHPLKEMYANKNAAAIFVWLPPYVQDFLRAMPPSINVLYKSRYDIDWWESELY